MGLKNQGAALIMCVSVSSACASAPMQVISVNDPRIVEIRIANSAEVYLACYAPGGRNDQGRVYGHNAELGGCYDPSTAMIWLSRSCPLFEIFVHELCHAVSGLSQKECDDRYPVHCQPGYDFSQIHPGGKP